MLYAAFATLAAVLFRITAEISVSGLTLHLALGASLPWLLALLLVGGAFGAIGGLLAGRGAVWAANPRLAFLATATLSAILLAGSLPSALAFQPQESSKLLSSTSPAFGSSAIEDPEASSEAPKTKASPASPSPSPATASTKRQGQEEEASEESLRRAEEDYYEAVARGDWDYTYTNLDSQSRQMFTREEWSLKNQYFANNGSLTLSSFDITEISSSRREATISLGPPFPAIPISSMRVALGSTGSPKRRSTFSRQASLSRTSQRPRRKTLKKKIQPMMKLLSAARCRLPSRRKAAHPTLRYHHHPRAPNGRRPTQTDRITTRHRGRASGNAPTRKDGTTPISRAPGCR